MSIFVTLREHADGFVDVSSKPKAAANLVLRKRDASPRPGQRLGRLFRQADAQQSQQHRGRGPGRVHRAGCAPALLDRAALGPYQPRGPDAERSKDVECSLLAVGLTASRAGCSLISDGTFRSRLPRSMG
jgi:hypothetical protein